MSLLSNLFHGGSRKRGGSVCLMFDFENLAISLRAATNSSALQLEPLQAFAHAQSPEGTVSVARAYADWRQFGRYADELTRLGIQTVQAPNHRLQGKNATDIQMAVEATDLLHLRQDLGVFILITGDSDFNPLVHLLRSRGKRVIGIGVRGSVSPYFENVCDEFYHYEEIVSPEKAKEVVPSSEAAKKETPNHAPPRAAKRSTAPTRGTASPSPGKQPTDAAALDTLGLDEGYRIPAERMKTLLPLAHEVIQEAVPSYPGDVKKGLLKRFETQITPHEAGALAHLLRRVSAYGNKEGLNWMVEFEGRGDDLFDLLLATSRETLSDASKIDARNPSALAQILFGAEMSGPEISMRITRGKKLHSELLKSKR